MSRMKLARVGKATKLAVLGMLLVVGIALFYCEARGIFPQSTGVAVSLGYVAFICLLLSWGIAPLPEGFERRFSIGRSRLLDIARAAACMVAALAWVDIGMGMVSDTPAGVASVLGPFFVILGAGAFFLAEAFSGAHSKCGAGQLQSLHTRQGQQVCARSATKDFGGLSERRSWAR
jgi:hypothetical protein